MPSKINVNEIRSFFRGEVLNDDATLKIYSRDASLFEVRPSLVVFPKDLIDIKNLIQFINNNLDKKLYLTARSGGTDMTGGPLGESIVLDFTKYFNHIKEIGDGYAITEPGVYYRDFEKEAAKRGLLLPSYPASKDICTVGGMVANNASGEKTLIYGSTAKYVESLKVVLSDGNEYEIKPLGRIELNKKLEQQNFEGEFYRKIWQLVNNNYELLRSAKPNVSKNSAGYYLWNIWDKEREVFDLTQLFTGSQGTLGLISEIRFRLIKPKAHSKLLIIFLRDISRLGELVNKILEYKPESFESYDDYTLKLTLRFLPDLVKRLHTNLISLAFQFLPEFFMVVRGGWPRLVLMAEFTGDSDDEANKKASAARDSLKPFRVISRITKTPLEVQKYWAIRRESFNILRQHVKGLRTAPFIDDFVVKPEQLPEFLPKLETILKQYNIIYTIAGHIGNANFHIIPLMNLANPQSRQIIKELSEKVYALILEYGGSITGEHNDGLIRSPYLPKMFGDKVYGLFGEVKKIFDPNNIFNPGKKVGSSWDYAMDHIAAS